jgi:hypothetical protein
MFRLRTHNGELFRLDTEDLAEKSSGLFLRQPPPPQLTEKVSGRGDIIKKIGKGWITGMEN